MRQLLHKNKKLILISLVFLAIYVIYFFTLPEKPFYPLVEQSKTELLQTLNREAEALGLQPIDEEDIYYTDVVANHSIGRYVDRNKLSEEALAELAREVPIYTYQVDTAMNIYELDVMSGKLAKAEYIYLEADGATFVKNYFGEAFTLKNTVTDESVFLDWTKKETYVAPTSYTAIEKVVDVFYTGSAITGFSYYGLAKGYPLATDSFTEGMIAFFVLLVIIGLVIFVSIHLLMKLIKKQVQAFWLPFILTVIAGLSWLFVSHALGSKWSGISFIETGIMIYLTFATLLIRWQKGTTVSLADQLLAHKQAIFQGLLWMIISVVLTETYFFVASFFDTWSSPTTSHVVFIQLEPWLLPLFTAAIGFSAAITEEAIFRNYFIPLLRKLGAVVAIFLSSAIWGILHIGYDMYPWYLYVLEFIILSGPLFYFVYVKYGFKTVIWLHYFYNAWATTLLLFYVDVNIALASLAVMLSPFLLFFIRTKKDVQVAEKS